MTAVGVHVDEGRWVAFNTTLGPGSGRRCSNGLVLILLTGSTNDDRGYIRGPTGGPQRHRGSTFTGTVAPTNNRRSVSGWKCRGRGRVVIIGKTRDRLKPWTLRVHNVDICLLPCRHRRHPFPVATPEENLSWLKMRLVPPVRSLAPMDHARPVLHSEVVLGPTKDTRRLGSDSPSVPLPFRCPWNW